MVCPRCGKDKYIRTSGKKQCLGCGYEEGSAVAEGAENPALFKTLVANQQPIERKHNGCDNATLRLSRIRLIQGNRRMVYVCNDCGYEEECEGEE